MTMNSFKVIWLDDECNEPHSDYIKRRATANNIELIAFTNAEEGLAELDKNFDAYDAILLDGSFHMKPSQSGEGDASAFMKVKDYLAERKGRGFIKDWFVLSDKILFKEPNSPFKIAHDIKVYDKGTDVDQLWKDIINAVNEQPYTKIRNKYPEAFKAIEELNLKEFNLSNDKFLIEILMGIEGTGPNFKDELYFGQLRIILESLFRRANKAGLLHDACLKGNEVNQWESYLFLSSGKTKRLGVNCKQVHFPKIIADNTRNIISITNAFAHTDEEGKEESRLDLLSFRGIINTSYLLYSLTFQLLDIIIWFNKYLKSNPDIEQNKSQWVNADTSQKVSNDWIHGMVIRIKDDYGTFQSESGQEIFTIPRKLVKEYHLREHQRIRLLPKLNENGELQRSERGNPLTDRIDTKI